MLKRLRKEDNGSGDDEVDHDSSKSKKSSDVAGGKKRKGNSDNTSIGGISFGSIGEGGSNSGSSGSSGSGNGMNAGSGRGLYTNKQRVLVLASRGITARYRHLLEDLKKLIPHHKKDNKLDSKGDIHVVNEIAEMKSCNNVIYLETRKHTDLYMYLGKTPNGPSVKFHVLNIHTTDELKLTGNCMLGSRPILNFDSKFETSPHWQLLKGLLTDTFGTPRGHPKSKPFTDRVMSFFVVKNNIWVRNYQIVDKSDRGDDTNLVEIGPRMVLVPIRLFSGSMGGATLYQNPAFISPNEERSAMKKKKGDKYSERITHHKHKNEYIKAIQPDPNPLNSVFKE